MRRVVSILLFVVGGWMLMSEAIMTFVDLQLGLGAEALVMSLFAGLAAVPLLLGTWASTGRRWQELGLTILIAAGVGLFSGVSMIAIFADPGARPFLPPMPKIAWTPIVGVVNLLVVGAIGWLLYRPARQSHRT
jgi:hypothetical protein